MEKTLVNRVANSKLKVINLEDFYPSQQIKQFDLKDYLFKELILKEKDFRADLKELDWSQYQNSLVAVHCSVDAIVPTWAYLLVSTYLAGQDVEHYFCTADSLLDRYYLRALDQIDWASYDGERVVIKGCSNRPVPTSAYVETARRLQPLAQSIMYGEPCSTVPVFKRPRKL